MFNIKIALLNYYWPDNKKTLVNLIIAGFWKNGRLFCRHVFQQMAGISLKFKHGPNRNISGGGNIVKVGANAKIAGSFYINFIVSFFPFANKPEAKI